MTIEELLLEIKKIPIAMINFDNKIIDNENNIDYNIKFLGRKLENLQKIYNLFISEQVQKHINPTKIRLICQDLEDIIKYIKDLVSYLTDAYDTLYVDFHALFYGDTNLDNGGKITSENYKERYYTILDYMVLYMTNNHEKFESMYITNMNIEDVIYKESTIKK